jgi:hypothetical protein
MLLSSLLNYGRRDLTISLARTVLGTFTFLFFGLEDCFGLISLLETFLSV